MTERSPAAAGSPPITLARVLLALAGLGLSVLLTLLLRDWLPHTQLAFFFPAIVLATFLGGTPLGIATGILGLIASEAVVFHADLYALDGLRAARIATFVIVWGGLILLVDRARYAYALAQQRVTEAEQLTSELNDQATELELQVTETETLANELEQVNAQLAKQSDAAVRAARRSERLLRFTARLLAPVGSAAVARIIVEEGRAAVDALGAAVVLAREGGTLEIVGAHGHVDALIDTDRERNGMHTPLRDALNGHAAWVADREELVERYPDVHDVPKQGMSWAALPLELDGRRVGALKLSFDRPGAFPQEDRDFMLLLAQQSAQALERARLNELELRARVRAEFAERRLAFIAEASARLAASLDYLATLANLAHITVPELADWCIVHLLDEHGEPRLVAATHADAERSARWREIEERRSLFTGESSPFARVLRSGQPVHIEPMTDPHLRTMACDDAQLEALRALGIRSLLAIPIPIEERAAGVMTLANAESARTFTDSDVTLALELGRRAGNAVENARLYQAAHLASEAKSDFLAVMSHELRTPLNAIIGYSDLLLMGVPDAVPQPALKQIGRIRSASTSLLHLVEEVLSFSRVEAGKEEIRISPVDVNAVLRECVAMIEPLAAEKRLDIVLDLPEEPLKIVSDERKIRQIVTNLLSNAVKFTEEGRITIGAAATDGELLIRIEDTGIGISEEHQERIFDPFWQVEQSATRRFGGTGLGLGVARKLAKLLEGRLDVESTLGAGSRFTLALPQRTPGMNRPIT